MARFAAGVWKKLETGNDVFCDDTGFWDKFPSAWAWAWVTDGEPASMNDWHAESIWALMSFDLTG